MLIEWRLRYCHGATRPVLRAGLVWGCGRCLRELSANNFVRGLMTGLSGQCGLCFVCVCVSVFLALGCLLHIAKPSKFIIQMYLHKGERDVRSSAAHAAELPNTTRLWTDLREAPVSEGLEKQQNKRLVFACLLYICARKACDVLYQSHARVSSLLVFGERFAMFYLPSARPSAGTKACWTRQQRRS